MISRVWINILLQLEWMCEVELSSGGWWCKVIFHFSSSSHLRKHSSVKRNKSRVENGADWLMVANSSSHLSSRPSYHILLCTIYCSTLLRCLLCCGTLVEHKACINFFQCKYLSVLSVRLTKTLIYVTILHKRCGIAVAFQCTVSVVCLL